MANVLIIRYSLVIQILIMKFLSCILVDAFAFYIFIILLVVYMIFGT